MLDKGTLVLECVTLAQVVKLVIEVLVDLPIVAVLHQKTSKDAETTHPEDLAVEERELARRQKDPSLLVFKGHQPRHTGIGSTLPLAKATVATDPSGKVQLPRPGPGVHCNRLANDETIGHELANGLARVGIANFIDLVGVEPDFSLAAADDRRGQALLSSEVDP